MTNFEFKLQSIIDLDLVRDNHEFGQESIINFEIRNDLKISDEYAKFLREFGNSYVKDNYLYRPHYPIDQYSKEKNFDVGAIYGFRDDNSNIQKEIDSYKSIIPKSYIPIADLQGGDLVLMDRKKGGIYFWSHEQPENENLFHVDDSFKDFIMNFNFVEPAPTASQNVKLNFSTELDDALRKAAEKYKK